MIKHRPCPFCGSDNVKSFCTGGYWSVSCQSCCSQSMPFCKDEQEAWGEWDKRCDDPKCPGNKNRRRLEILNEIIILWLHDDNPSSAKLDKLCLEAEAIEKGEQQ